MSTMLYHKGMKVTLNRRTSFQMGSQEERQKLEVIKKQGIPGIVIDIESMGELDMYQVDFGDAQLTQDWWWEPKELFPLELT